MLGTGQAGASGSAWSLPVLLLLGHCFPDAPVSSAEETIHQNALVLPPRFLLWSRNCSVSQAELFTSCPARQQRAARVLPFQDTL